MESRIDSMKASKVDPEKKEYSSGKKPQHQTGSNSLDFIPCRDDLNSHSKLNKERGVGLLSKAEKVGSTTNPEADKAQIDKKHLPTKENSA